MGALLYSTTYTHKLFDFFKPKLFFTLKSLKEYYLKQILFLFLNYGYIAASNDYKLNFFEEIPHSITREMFQQMIIIGRAKTCLKLRDIPKHRHEPVGIFGYSAALPQKHDILINNLYTQYR